MSKDKKMEKRGGYQPLNEGYQGDVQRGYTPSGPEAVIDPANLPQDGTGQSGAGQGGSGDSGQSSGNDS